MRKHILVCPAVCCLRTSRCMYICMYCYLLQESVGDWEGGIPSRLLLILALLIPSYIIIDIGPFDSIVYYHIIILPHGVLSTPLT